MSLLERAVRPFMGVSASTFATLSRIRSARVFHPVGRAFHASIVWDRTADRWLPDVLARPRRHDAIVRFSRGAGLPAPLPDIMGMAIKIPGIYGHSWDQDWLMVTSAHDPVRRHLLIPSFDLLARPYSTVLPYRRRAGDLVTFGARAARDARASSFEALGAAIAEGGVTFEFSIAAEGEDHVRLGSIELIGPSEGTGDPLRFNPWNTSSELRPAGGLNELRRESYRASQAARPKT